MVSTSYFCIFPLIYGSMIHPHPHPVTPPKGLVHQSLFFNFFIPSTCTFIIRIYTCIIIIKYYFYMRHLKFSVHASDTNNKQRVLCVTSHSINLMVWLTIVEKIIDCSVTWLSIPMLLIHYIWCYFPSFIVVSSISR